MNPLAFFRRWRAIRVEVLKRDPLRITIDEFKKDPGLVHSAAKALKDPVVRQMLDVLWFDAFIRSAPSVCEPTAIRLSHADMAAGCRLCLGNMESLGKPFENPKEAEANYAPENAEIEE
jgi:hypothetical protein